VVEEDSFLNSPIDYIKFNNLDFFIKRDDLLHLNFNGNKARKFYYFIKQDFKDINKIISYGSNQSNAMVSLSYLAKLKNVKLDYYVSHISSYLQNNPQGNYLQALNNGANIINLNIHSNLEQYINKNIKIDKYEILLQEGGRVTQSQYGIKLLAQEINSWAKKQNIQKLNIFLPSGTGTTALFLQHFTNFKVYTCACVADENYLHKQFTQLSQNSSLYPTILKTPQKFYFGKLYKENYNIYKKLLDHTGIEFDLLYDPIGWQTLLKHYSLLNKYPILYIHQGGVRCNETMLNRFKLKFNI
jgi:1-aminocyclopropane-1-carboxylate deaminase/D-cysteine desulfhydrase-like pyridoxal-dependent ACC family enzyme